MLSLLARLGVVLYWLSCLLAAGLLIFSGTALYDHDYRAAGFMVAFGVGFWLIGRACMFVLAGR
jgi:hypothetical protein